MVFNDKLIFIHIGKTGGMSCSRYLLENLTTPIYNCHKQALEDLKAPRIKHAIPLERIGRHSTLSEALAFIGEFNGKALRDFEKVIAVIRHPYTLEYSYYQHIKKPHILERNRKLPYFSNLAKLDFQAFVEQSDYHRRGHSQEKFFLVDNEVPATMELIRFEDLATSFPRAVAPYLKEEEVSIFPENNRSSYPSDIEKHLTPEVKEMIYQKHRYMFDSGLYGR